MYIKNCKSKYTAMKPFIPLFTILFLAAALFSVSDTYSQETVEYYQHSFSTSSGKTFKADTDLGNINVTGSSSNVVNILVNGNPDYKNDFNISANESSDGIDLKITFKEEKDHSYKNLSLKIDVTVPESYSLNLSTKGGNIKANNIRGEIGIATYGGNIKMNSITGNTMLTTKGGNIAINNIRGDLNAFTDGGNVLVDAFTGNVKTQTKGGNITLAGSDGAIDAVTFGGNISLDYLGSNMGMNLKTMAGNISAKIPESTSADVKISTTVGKIVSDLITPEKADQYSTSSNASGKINGGGNMITIETNAGNVHLSKK